MKTVIIPKLKFSIDEEVRLYGTDNKGVITDILFSPSGRFVYKVNFFGLVPLYLEEEMLETTQEPWEYMS